MFRKLCDYFLKCALLPLLVLGLVFYLALRPRKTDTAPALTENPPNRYEHLWLVNGDPWLLTSDGTLMRMGNGMCAITLPASRADYCIADGCIYYVENQKLYRRDPDARRAKKICRVPEAQSLLTLTEHTALLSGDDTVFLLTLATKELQETPLFGQTLLDKCGDELLLCMNHTLTLFSCTENQALWSASPPEGAHFTSAVFAEDGIFALYDDGSLRQFSREGTLQKQMQLPFCGVQLASDGETLLVLESLTEEDGTSVLHLWQQEEDAWQELYLQATLYDTDFPAHRLFCTDGTKYAIATEYNWTQGRTW